MRRRIVLGLLIGGLAIILVGCAYSIDVWVVNPCPKDLRVEISSDRAEHFNRYPPHRSVTIPATSLMKVEDAFINIFEGSIRITGYDRVIPVDDNTSKHQTVLLPLDACSTAYEPPASPVKSR